MVRRSKALLFRAPHANVMLQESIEVIKIFKTTMLLLLLSFSINELPASEKQQILAKLKPGNIVGGKESTVVITDKPQEIFSHHAHFKGGGIYYSVKIYVKETNVIIEETNSISTQAEKDKGVKSNHKVYTIKISELNSTATKLQLGNELTVVKSK